MTRKRVDLRTLPPWAQYAIALVVVAVVAGIAYAVSDPQASPAVVPVSAVVAALIAFSLLAWGSRRR